MGIQYCIVGMLYVVCVSSGVCVCMSTGSEKGAGYMMGRCVDSVRSMSNVSYCVDV